MKDMTREEAHDLLVDFVGAPLTDSPVWESACEAIVETHEVAYRLGQQTPPGWVKCSEQMPPNSGEFVLVATRNGCVGEALYEDGKWPDAIDVTHWMPLPPAPSPVSDDLLEDTP